MVILTNNDPVTRAFSDNILTGESVNCSMCPNKLEGCKIACWSGLGKGKRPGFFSELCGQLAVVRSRED